MSKVTLSKDTLAELRQIDTPTVSNAIEHFTVRDPVIGYPSMELACQFPDYDPMVGYAVTCTADTTTRADDRPMRSNMILDAIQDAPKPAVLVIQYVGTDRLRSCFVGDMVCAAVQKLGGVGVVTNGGYRDKSGIRKRAAGMQVFSPGQVASHGYGVFFNVNVKVEICGLAIEPGDLLHGNESGLISIPLEIAASVIDQAKKVHEREKAYFDFLDSSSYSFEQLKKHVGRH